MNKQNTLPLLHLTLIPNIGPASILKVIKGLSEEEKKVELDELYRFKARDFIHQFELSPRVAALLSTGLSDKKKLDQELNLIEKYKIKILSFLDDEYPALLKEIYHPPPIIYCKGGKLDVSAKRIAIVGSRKADGYAKECIQKLVPMLVAHGWEIVSGGATGVDSMAHRETVKAGGKTIAVFGAGLMNPYPLSNKELFREIVKSDGALVSPFPLQTTPNKGTFPARNRVVSGLSEGCIIVQAAQRSGALITAHFALNQGRQVFALPGKVTNELSAGCHRLIQEGAKLITNVDDILEEFGHAPFESLDTSPFAKAAGDTRDERELGPARRSLGVGVDERELKHPILTHLKSPCSLDELSCKTNLSLEELQGKLFQLQLEGVVRQNHAGLWEAEL